LAEKDSDTHAVYSAPTYSILVRASPVWRSQWPCNAKP